MRISALRQALSTFNRTAAQLKRLYGIDPADFMPGIPRRASTVVRRTEAMRLAAERIRIGRQVEERERREAERMAREEAIANLEISNLKERISDAFNAITGNQARADVEKSKDTIEHMINDSVRIWGAVDTVKGLEKWAANFENEVLRFVTAIYDDFYNTNTNPFHRDMAGDIGRARYHAARERLANLLGVSVPIFVDTSPEYDEDDF